MGLYQPLVSQILEVTLDGRGVKIPPKHGNHILLSQLRPFVDLCQNPMLAVIEPRLIRLIYRLIRLTDRLMLGLIRLMSL